MSFTWSLEYSWYDAYKDPDELAAVQSALDAAQAPGSTIDWDQLLDAESDGFAETFSNTSGPVVYAAIGWLTDDQAGTVVGVDRLDIVPVSFPGGPIDLRDHNPRTQLYAADEIVRKWRERGPVYTRMQEGGARQYEQADRRGNWEETDTGITLTDCYAQVTLVKLAKLALEFQVPARLFG